MGGLIAGVQAQRVLAQFPRTCFVFRQCDAELLSQMLGEL